MRGVVTFAGALALTLVLPALLLGYTEIPPALYDVGWLEFASPEQGVIIAASWDELSFWDLKSKDKLMEIDMNSRITEVDRSSLDMIAVGKMNGQIDVLNGSQFTLTYTLNQLEGVSALEWSQSGEVLVSSSSRGKLFLWKNGTAWTNWWAHSDWVYAVSISRDEKFVASSSEDHTFKVFNISNTSTVVDIYLTDDWVTDMEWSPSNNLLAYVTWSGRVVVFNPFQNMTVLSGSLSQGFSYIHWSPEGDKIYVSGGRTILASWTLEDGELLFMRTLRKRYSRAMAISPDGTIATTTGSYKIVIWDAQGSQISSLPDRTIPTLFYIVLVAGFVGYSLMIAEAEIVRRRSYRAGDFIYGERKLTTTQIGLFFLMSIFACFLYTYFFSILYGDAFNILPYIIVLVAFLSFTFGFATPRSLMVDRRGLYMPISTIQEVLKTKKRFVPFDEIARIQPRYSYTISENSLKKTGLDVTTLSDETYTILPTGVKEVALGIEEIERAISQAMGDRWSEVYDEIPRVDFERWSALREYVPRSYKSLLLELAAMIILPYCMIFYLFYAGWLRSFELFMTFMLVTLMLTIVAIMVGMTRLMKYNEAMGLYHKIQLYNKLNPENAIPLGVKPADVFDPEDFLKMSAEDWQKLARLLGREKVWNSLLVLSYGPFVVGLIGLLEFSPWLMILLFIGIALLILSFLKGIQIQRNRSKIGRAVEHELKTGKTILPPGFKIPSSYWSPQFIIREPTRLTDEERRLVERFLSMDAMHMTLQVIGLTLAFVCSVILVVTFSPLPHPWSLPLAFVPLAILLPILLWKQMKTGKAVQKYKAIKKYEELIAERRGKR